MTRRDYLLYLRYACRVQVVPMPPECWDMLTRKSVDAHWENWRQYISRGRPLASWADVEDDRESAWSLHKRAHRSGDILLADVKRSGLFIGELRPDGSVCPPRHRETLAPSRGGLLFRLCRLCRAYLPVLRFYSNGLTTRAICKSCERDIRRMKASELRNPVDRAHAERAEKSAPLMPSRKLPSRAFLNWCPDCRAYRSENHPQPCGAAVMAAAAGGIQ